MLLLVLLVCAAKAGLIAGLCIFFLLILPLLVLAAFCGYRHRDRLVSFWQRTKARVQNATERSVPIVQASAGLTMWQMWQMPRASGLGGPPEVEKIFFQPVSSQVI